MARLADRADQPIVRDEVRQDVVLDVARDARLAGAVAVGDVDLPVVRLGIIWNATRLPSRESAGASMRSGPLRTMAALAGSATAPTMSRFSSPSRAV